MADKERLLKTRPRERTPLHVENAKELIKNQNRIHITVYLTREERAKLKSHAAQVQLTLNDLVRQRLEDIIL